MNADRFAHFVSNASGYPYAVCTPALPDSAPARRVLRYTHGQPYRARPQDQLRSGNRWTLCVGF